MHRLPLTILLLVLFALPLRAGAVEHKFRLSLAGVSVATVVLNVDRAGDRYTANARVRGRGLVGAFVDMDYDGTSRGRIGPDGMPRPELFQAQRKDDEDGGRTTVVRYSGGVPVSVTADPPYPQRPWNTIPRAQRGTVDPIAAAVAVIDDQPVGAACNRTVEIYDGRRRSRIILGGASRAGQGWICSGIYRRVAGYPPKKMQEQVDFPFAITYEERDGKMRVMRVDMDSTYGTGRLERL